MRIRIRKGRVRLTLRVNLRFGFALARLACGRDGRARAFFKACARDVLRELKRLKREGKHFLLAEIEDAEGGLVAITL